MFQFINKFMYILLIVFITFLVLNEFYVIDFSENLKNIFIFLTLILILLTSMKEILSGKNGFVKFLNVITLFCTIVGGIFSIAKGQLNTFIYICLAFSLINGILVLTYSKT